MDCVHILSYILVLLCISLVASGPAVQFQAPVYINNNFYHISDVHVDHTTAVQQCATKNGRLVSITKEEEESIQKLLTNNQQYFISGHFESEGHTFDGVCYTYVRTQGKWTFDLNFDGCNHSAGYICKLISQRAHAISSTTTKTAEGAVNKNAQDIVIYDYEDVDDVESQGTAIKKMGKLESILIIAFSCSALTVMSLLAGFIIICKVKRERNKIPKVLKNDEKPNINLNFPVYNGIDAGNGSVMTIKDLGYDKRDKCNHYEQLDVSKMNLKFENRVLSKIIEEPDIDSVIYEELDEPRVQSHNLKGNSADEEIRETISHYEDISNFEKNVSPKQVDNRNSFIGDDTNHYHEIGEGNISEEQFKLRRKQSETKERTDSTEPLYATVKKSKTNHVNVVKNTNQKDDQCKKVITLDIDKTNDDDLALWENDFYSK